MLVRVFVRPVIGASAAIMPVTVVRSGPVIRARVRVAVVHAEEFCLVGLAMVIVIRPEVAADLPA